MIINRRHVAIVSDAAPTIAVVNVRVGTPAIDIVARHVPCTERPLIVAVARSIADDTGAAGTHCDHRALPAWPAIDVDIGTVRACEVSRADPAVVTESGLGAGAAVVGQMAAAVRTVAGP